MIFFGVGRVFAGQISEKYFYYLGFKMGLLGLSLIFTLQIYVINFSVSALGLWFGFVLNGALFYLVLNANTLLISEKYKGSISSIKYFHLFRLVAAMFWAILLTFIMNPENKPLNITAINGDMFYDENISERYSIFLH